MSRWLAVACAGILLLLGGCDQQALMKRLVPAAQEQTARGLIEDLRAGRVTYIEEHLSAAYRDGNTHATLLKVAALFPNEKPLSVKTVGSQTNWTGGVTTYNFTFEYQFSHKWLLAWVNFKESEGLREIAGIGVQPLAQSLEDFNAFTLVGKTPFHFGFLAATIFAALFTLITFIVCLFTPIPSFKWVWAIWVLFGVVQFNFNWTTGAFDWHLIAVNLFAAGFAQSLYGPIVLQCAIPLGAIMFWANFGRWRREARGLPPGDLRAE